MKIVQIRISDKLEDAIIIKDLGHCCYVVMFSDGQEMICVDDDFETDDFETDDFETEGLGIV